MTFNNFLITGEIKDFKDIGLRKIANELLGKYGCDYIINYILSIANQFRDNQEYLANNLLRKTSRDEFLAAYLNADGLNLSGIEEEAQANMALILRGLHFRMFTWNSFSVMRVLLSDLGATIFPTIEDTIIYYLLKQERNTTALALRIAETLATPDGKKIVLINTSDDKELTIGDGLKGVGETVLPVVVVDGVYPWVRVNTNIDIEARADFGYGFFKDDVTKTKDIWIGHFKKNVVHTSLFSLDGKNWRSVFENQVFAQISESDYQSFGNVDLPVSNGLIPLMIGGHFPSGVTADIYWRKQEYPGLGSEYTFEKAHVGEFSPRQDAGAVWFKNKIWVIGGLGQDDANSVDVWNSPFTDSDKTFSLINDTPPWSFVDDTNKDVFGHRVVVFKDKMWFLGGQKTTNQFYNRVYSSVDGIDWIRQPDPPWSARSYFGAVSILDRIYIFGGKFFNKVNLETEVFNDVWYTKDGTNWIFDGNADFKARSNFGYLADEEKRKIYLFGGKNSAGLEYSDFYEHYIL